MNGYYILILFLLISSILFAQPDTNRTIILGKLVRSIQPDDTIDYADKLLIEQVKPLFKLLMRHKVYGATGNTKNNFIVLSRKERIYLIKKLKESASTTWSESLFPNSHRIPTDSCAARVKAKYKQFVQLVIDTSNQDSVKQVFERGKYKNYLVFAFSDIIFMRDYSIFLNYLLWHCGDECGHEELTFYKNENGEWKRWIVVGSGWW